MSFAATEPMLRARASQGRELAGLERRVRRSAQDGPVRHRLMSMPGAVEAPTHRSAGDDLPRFASSKGPTMGPPHAAAQPVRRTRHLGRDHKGRGSQPAAHSLPSGGGHDASLPLDTADTMGSACRASSRREPASVALARRIGVIPHRIWAYGTTFRSEVRVPYAA